MRLILPPAALLLIILACASPLLGSSPIQAAEPAPNVVLDLTVSIEWLPGDDDRLPSDLAAAGCPATAESTFVADLDAGLREFARYFYSYTGGQMAIGKVTIYTDGEQWDNADIRLLANRSYRPSAFVGGIVETSTPYYARTGDATPTTIFQPGAIFLSRLWDGSGARCGPWSAAAGWRTIGHEWGHYALYLYDEYLDLHSGAQQLCDETSLGPVQRRVSSATKFTTTIQSLMAYHYTADQLSLWPSGVAPLSCRNTPQMMVYNRSDWATVAQMYAAEGVTAPSVLRAVTSAAPAISVNLVPPTTPRTNTSALVRLDALPGGTLVGQAYLIRPDSSSGAPQRILGQGNILPGEALPAQFWGVQTDTADRAAVRVQDPRGGPQYSYPKDYRSAEGATPLSTDALNLLSASASSWEPGLTIEPLVTTNPNGGSDVTGLRVQLNECSIKPPSRVQFVYCPAGGACSKPVAAAQISERVFTHTFAFSPDTPPADYGYIYAREPLRGAETLTWYQLAGGVGPTHIGAHAPQLDGLVSLDMPQNNPNAAGDNRILYSPAPICAQPQPLPGGVLGMLGPAFNVQTIIADREGGQPWNGDDPPLSVRLSYDQDLLDRLGISEERLIVLRLTRQGWQALPTSGRSFALDWIAAQPQLLSGGGDTYALGYGRALMYLPLAQR